MPLRTYIPNLQHHLARNLLLHVEVVVLHIRSWKIPVNRENVTARRTARCFEYRRAWCDRADDSHGGNRRRPCGVVANAGTEDAVIRQLTEKHILGDAVEKHSPTCADYRAAFAKGIPSHAQARREVLVVRLIHRAQPWLAQLRQRYGLCYRVKRSDVGEQAVFLADDAIIIPAQPEIESESRTYLPSILSIQAVIVLVGMPNRVAER